MGIAYPHQVCEPFPAGASLAPATAGFTTPILIPRLRPLDDCERCGYGVVLISRARKTR